MSDGPGHVGDRFRLWLVASLLVGSCLIISGAVGALLWDRQQVGVAGFIGVVLIGLITGVGCTALVWRVTGVGSRSLVQAMTGAGNIRRAPSYSLQESFIMRGKFTEAEAAFQAHLAAHPEDLDAHLALAALVRDQMKDPARAERLFLEARARRPTPHQEYAIANALIDLYRATGQTGREMAELARFADRYPGTEGGRRARAALGRLKAGTG